MRRYNKIPAKYILIIILFFVSFLYLATFLIPTLVPYSLYEQSSQLKYNFASTEHLFGCDYLGRDVLIRICFGIRLSIEISVFSVIVGTVTGTIYGILAAYIGGRQEVFMCAILDILQSVPDFLIAMLLMSVITTISETSSVIGILLTIVILYWIPVARIVRTTTKDMLKEDYVTYSKLSGGRFFHLTRFDVIPNIRNIVITTAALRIPSAIFLESFLSFIGVGIKPPVPSLGKMISEGVDAFRIAPHLLIIPSIALVLIVMCFNLIGDTLIRVFKETVIKINQTSNNDKNPINTMSAQTDDDIMFVSGLDVNYRSNNLDKSILRGISFSIKKREIISIIGESGCGKSTLVKSVLGLLNKNFEVKSSIVEINGIRFTQQSNVYKSLKKSYGNSFGLVFQDSIGSLNPTMTIGRHFMMLYRQLPKPKPDYIVMAKKALSEVGLGEMLDVLEKYPAEISGGMAQKVNISLALFKNPLILFLDEPTSSLDAQSQTEVIDLICQINSTQNIAICMITHDISLAERISNRIAIMKNGMIVEVLQSCDIKNSQQEYTRELVRNADDVSISYISTESENEKTKNLPIIEARNLKKGFGERQVLDGVSFNIWRGESVGLIGRSGIGKSTICKILTGLYKADSGDLIFSENIRIEMVFQNANKALNPSKSIQQILKEQCTIKRIVIDDNYVLELFDVFGLSLDILNRKPFMLSGGQQQKVALLRALLTKPDLLIFDEPTTALDVISQREILDLILKLKQELCLTYLFVSHNPYVIRKMCTRVLSL